jgi:hypothetical protein
MSRHKKQRMKGLTDPPARKGHYLTEELNEVQKELVERDIWGKDFYGMGDVVTPSQAVRQKPQINMALVNALLKMQGVVLGPVEDVNALEKDITWVLAGNGIFQVRKTKYGVVCGKVEKVSIETLPDWKPPAYRWPLPLIPWAVFAPAVAFLRWVKQTYDTEGLIRAYFNEDLMTDPNGGWTIHVPNQRVSAVSVDVANTEPDPGLGDFAMEMHSHPGGSSVFSGTDDENEQRQRLFGCVAGLTEKPNPPNFHWRIGTGAEMWAEVDLDDIVEVGEAIPFNITPIACLKNTLVFDPFQSAVFPEAWKERVTAPSRSSGGATAPSHRIHSYPPEQRTLVTESDEDLLRKFRENEEKWHREHNRTYGGGSGSGSQGRSYNGRTWKT